MKKQITTTMLEEIQHILNAAYQKQLIKKIPSSTHIIHLVDADVYDTSDFYFAIFPEDINRKFKIEYKPTSGESLKSTSFTVDIKTAAQYLDAWIKILERYANIKTIFDNPARYHAQNFFNDFNLDPSNANNSTLPIQKIILLDQYLESASQTLAELLPQQPAEKQEELKEIISEINTLKENLTTLSKLNIIQKLSEILGKTLKNGLSLFKKVFSNIKDKLIDKISETSVEVIADKANDIVDTISQSF